MKNFEKIILSGLIISFYFIQISYNGTPSNSLGGGLIDAFKTGFLIVIYIIYLIVNISFVIWFVKSQKYYSVMFVMIPIIVWFIWKIEFDGIIDTKLYVKSSIPFLLFSFMAVIYSTWLNKR